LATRDAAAAQDAITKLKKETFLDELRDQGISGVEILSLSVKVK
jgi:hypothetical protein